MSTSEQTSASKPSETVLIFNREYHCWRNEVYLGIATYIEDENVGPAFIKMCVSEYGELIHEVWIPTKFELI